MTPNANVSDHFDQINQLPKQQPLASNLKLIRKSEVLEITCRSRSSLYSDINAGLMPPPISIGGRSVAFLESEVLAVVAARIKGLNNEEVRTLVQKLIAERNNVV